VRALSAAHHTLFTETAGDNGEALASHFFRVLHSAGRRIPAFHLRLVLPKTPGQLDPVDSSQLPERLGFPANSAIFKRASLRIGLIDIKKLPSLDKPCSINAGVAAVTTACRADPLPSSSMRKFMPALHGIVSHNVATTCHIAQWSRRKVLHRLDYGNTWTAR